MTFTTPQDRARATAPTQKLTEQQIDTMRTWRKAGQSYKQLSWFFNVSVNSVRYHCDEARHQRRLEEKRTHARWEIFGSDYESGMRKKVIEQDAKVLKKQIPKDTRSFTARFCGDPLPGRSALDERGQSEGAPQ